MEKWEEVPQRGLKRTPASLEVIGGGEECMRYHAPVAHLSF